MSTSNQRPFIERRTSGRPGIGDRRPCPKCGETMRFFERYVVRRGGMSRREPAWVCQCGFEEYVRQPD